MIRDIRLRNMRRVLTTFWLTSKTELLICGGYFVALLLVWPSCNFGLNDDWTYGRSVMLLHESGKLELGTSSSSIITHLYWGLLFVKVFGFSFTVLRISSWVSVIIFIFLFYRLTRNITGNPAIATVFTLAMIFNPIFFSISNTFMTDVNFCTLFVCCLWSARKFWDRQNTSHFITFFVFSLMLVFVRQLGLIVPALFIFICFFVQHRKWKWIFLSSSGFLLICVLLWYFEKSVAVPENSGYQSPAKFSVTDPAFWPRLFENLNARYSRLVANTSVWSAPLLLIYLWPFARRAGWIASLVCFLVSAGCTYLLFDPHAFPLGNIFFNMSLGAETFYESLKWPRAPYPHTYSHEFAKVLTIIAVLSELITLLVILLLGFIVVSGRAKARERFLLVFCLLFVLGYKGMLLIPDMYFDRYHLPIPIALALMAASVHPAERIRTWPVYIYLIPMLYVSVAGTHDYFRRHRIMHEANRHLRHDLGVPMERINAGHEINNWHEGQPFVTWDHLFIEPHNYLIQYNVEEGFRPYREYEFRRFFPPKNDKIYIFERIDKIP